MKNGNIIYLLDKKIQTAHETQWQENGFTGTDLYFLWEDYLPPIWDSGCFSPIWYLPTWGDCCLYKLDSEQMIIEFSGKNQTFQNDNFRLLKYGRPLLSLRSDSHPVFIKKYRTANFQGRRKI